MQDSAHDQNEPDGPTPAAASDGMAEESQEAKKIREREEMEREHDVRRSANLAHVGKRDLDHVAPHATWVQTDRKTHMAWATFGVKNPTASALMHLLVAQMGDENAVIISQTVLAEMIGVTEKTIRAAIQKLQEGFWIEVVHIGRGRECAYVVNSRVGWGQARKDLSLALFSARVVASRKDQPKDAPTEPLLKFPELFPGEGQLPSPTPVPNENVASAGNEQDAEPYLPDLPAIRRPMPRIGVNSRPRLGAGVGKSDLQG